MKRLNDCRLGLLSFKFYLFILLFLVAIDSDPAGAIPIADAGLPRYAGLEPVILDGMSSYDPDESGPLSYSWQQISGPMVIISDANTSTPTITGFVQTEEIQECEFELIVRAGERESEPDTVKVVIVPTFVSGNIMVLENDSFDPNKPTFIWFDGAYSASDLSTGGGHWSYNKANIESNELWEEKANIISFDPYYADPGSICGWHAGERMVFSRCADQIIVFLSDKAPDYIQPIQIAGLSLGGIPAIDVALRLNQTYADARYAINHVTFLDATTAVLDYPEYSKRVASFLSHPVDGEQCWFDSYDSAYGDFYPSALNVVFSTYDHVLAAEWYHASLSTPESYDFNGGIVAGAYWSVIGPGKNLQLASTPNTELYQFMWIGSATSGHLDPLTQPPSVLPEPVTLLAYSLAIDANDLTAGVLLTCKPSKNAVRYQFMIGSDAYRVMDYDIIFDSPNPPYEIITTNPVEKTWWTIRVRDQYDSTIYADPMLLDFNYLFSRGLAAHWALDETEGIIAKDSAGENDAYVFGGPTWQPAEGMVRGALELDGFDDFAITDSIEGINEGPFRVFAWIKGGAPGQVVLSQMGGANWFSIDSSEGYLMTELADPTSNSGPLRSQTVITDGTWHRLGFAWDGSRRTLYIDDVVVAQDTQDRLQVSSNGLYIGTGKMMQPGTYFSGLIDDVRIYNRVVSP